jgi:hypothetical protein
MPTGSGRRQRSSASLLVPLLPQVVKLRLEIAPISRSITPAARAAGGLGRIQAVHGLDFAAQYQQEPVAEGGNLINWKWFPCYDRPPYREIKDKIILSWDTAVSARELSSYSVCVILQVRGETVFGVLMDG